MTGEQRTYGVIAGGPERRAQLTAELMERTGINDAMIEKLVATFYAKVRLDDLIGPIFEERVKDWDEHLSKLRDFWSSVALMTGRYHGRPMQAHLPLPVDRSHFERWLGLFEETAQALCPPVAASHFIERARRIADSFELGIATQRGEVITPRWERMVGTQEPSPAKS